MKRILILLFCCIASTHLLAQKTTTQFISGQVIDQNKFSIAGATIRNLANSAEGAVSDNNGFFSFTTSSASPKISISYLGYVSDTVALKFPLSAGGLLIKLKQDVYSIPEVVINDSRFTILLGDEKTRVVDYKISGELYSISANKNSQAFQLLNPENDSKIDSIPYTFQTATQIFADCFGNIHILSKDSAFQVYYNSGLSIVAKIGIRDFNEKLINCKLSYDSVVLYERRNAHNHTSVFSLISSNQKKDIYKIEDISGKKVSQQDLAEIINIYNQSVSSIENLIFNKVWDGQLYKLAVNPELNRMISWYENNSAVSNPNYLISHFPNMLIYDNTNSKLVTFNENFDQLAITNTSFSNQKDWKELIYNLNEETLYSHYQKDGISTLMEINIVTGQFTGKAFTIKYHTFPQNIQVSGNKIFYLHRNGGAQVKLIYQKFK